MIGYSRLMEEADEEGTLARLKALRRELFDPKTTQYGGRIFKITGHGALAEFKSAVDAVNSALDIQRALAERQDDLAQDRRIPLRIGIGPGEVSVQGSDLYGNGVNVAARMEELAEPGGICVSGGAYDHIAGRPRAADGQEHRPTDPRAAGEAGRRTGERSSRRRV